MELGMLRRNRWYAVGISNNHTYLNGLLSTWWRRLYWWPILTFLIIVGKEEWGIGDY